MGVSAECGSGLHRSCPGFFKMAHRCGCGCHQQPKEEQMTGSDVVVYDRDARREICSMLGIKGSDTQISLLFKLAEHYQLDVLTKEISLIPGKGPFIGVWGRLAIAHRSGRLDGLEMDDEWETDTHVCVRVVVWRSDMRHPAAKVIGRVRHSEGKDWPVEIARARGLRAALGYAFSIHDSYDSPGDDWVPPPEERLAAEVVPADPGEEVSTGSSAVVAGRGRMTSTGEVHPVDPGPPHDDTSDPPTRLVGGHSAGQRIAMAANEAGLNDAERHDVVWAASAGEYGGGSEIPEDDEATIGRVLEAMVGLRDGTIELRYDPDGAPALFRVRVAKA